MSGSGRRTMDGNEAVASVAYRLNEVVAIYPITPASPMGEHADAWAAAGRPNLWGLVPEVIEMQSEGGAVGAVHGALQAGALTTTFTASQGLLLMVPNLYKIAGELTPMCLHVAARTVATHALSIFCDHSDVMACRQTGFAQVFATSVQEAQDLACIAQLAALESRVPFMTVMDGFRTSHEVNTIEVLTDEQLRRLVSDELVRAHRRRALTPNRPVIRGTAQNPDAFFQAREACSTFYAACPDVFERVVERFAEVTGRRVAAFEYTGHEEARQVLVVMGSAAATARATVEELARRGRPVGLVTVRLYRPFDAARFVALLPPTVQSIAVLDRTKEPGATGEPLYLDVVAAIAQAGLGGAAPRVVGGRYGLSSKEFTPAMVKAVLDHLETPAPRHGFTLGIVDDVMRSSLPVDPTFRLAHDGEVQALFYGLGSDGTVSANKNTIKIIGDRGDRFAQGYFVYDSKKAGSVTVSHLRFGPRPIEAPYLIDRADFVACHQFAFLERMDVLARAGRGATVLLNAPLPPDRIWDALPREMQQRVVDLDLRLFFIDAQAIARQVGLGRRINTIMQVCFFALTQVMPMDEAREAMEAAIRSTYGRKGPELVRRNLLAIDASLEALHEVPRGDVVGAPRPPVVPPVAPDFVQRVTALMMAGEGDRLPVSAFPVDGTWPVGTTQWEKRNIAIEIPRWEPDLCIQCNKCAFVCPHAAIRAKVYDPELLDGAPPTFQSVPYKGGLLRGLAYTIQVAPEDCTGCHVCVEVCPAKDKASPQRKAINMVPQAPLRASEAENYAFFLGLPDPPRAKVKRDVKESQLLAPLFEYSGACAGCGETPYIKLLTQLFGDRLLIANATGCSSIYGGNLPATPYRANAEGRGPAWSNSLFEDNAEFGLGMRLALDQAARYAGGLLRELAGRIGDELVEALLTADQSTEAGIEEQRRRVELLRRHLATIEDRRARRLDDVADYLVKTSLWIVGGDGWAYDIGFGGLDHVLAGTKDVNILVLDTEVYSNTGGQSSKATPMGAAAKFAAAGKETFKKDLGALAMSYGTAYVAQIAFGAKDAQTVRAMVEAESYPGPSILIAYSHCIAHGYDLAHGPRQQRLATETGMWPLYRFDPRRRQAGQAPLILDSKPPRRPLSEYVRNEARFRVVEAQDKERFRRLMAATEAAIARRFERFARLATPPAGGDPPGRTR